MYKTNSQYVPVTYIALYFELELRDLIKNVTNAYRQKLQRDNNIEIKGLFIWNREEWR